MKTILTLALLIVAHADAFAQMDNEHHRIVVYLKNATALAGTLIAIDDASISIASSGASRRVPLDSVRIAELIEPTHFDIGPIASVGGMYLGALAATASSNDAEDHYFVRTSDDEPAVVLGASLGAAIGGTIALLFGERRDDIVREYDLSTRESRSAFIERASMPMPSYPHWLVEAQLGGVLEASQEKQRAALVAAGYDGQLASDPTQFNDRVSSFTLLRRVEACMSLTRVIDVGLAWTLLAQPSTYADSYDLPGTGSKEGRGLREDYSGWAATAVGNYRLLFMSDRMMLRGGLGVGLAKQSFTRTETEHYESTSDRYLFDERITDETSKMGFAAGMKLELAYRARGLITGLSMDYMFTPAMDIDANAELGIASSSFGLSSLSIGISVGVEF